jgi:hypothetical protein
MASLRPVVRVLFDEAHCEAWSIRPAMAAAMQPTHPQDVSYADAAALLRAERMTVAARTDGLLDERALCDADVVVLAHPSAPKWEATTQTGSPVLTDAELEALHAFVARGGGLVVLGESEHDKYGNNLNMLLAPFGVALEHATVQDYARHHRATPSWVLADLGQGERGASGDLLTGVGAACFYRAGTLRLDHRPNGAATQVLARTAASATTPGAPLAVAVRHGRGRVVVAADSDLFGDDCLAELGHAALWRNIVTWAAASAYARAAAGAGGAARDGAVAGPSTSATAATVDPARARLRDNTTPTATATTADPAWARLRDATDALRLRQEPDGSVTGDHDAVRALVATMADAVRALAPRFAHQAEHLDAVVGDLWAWVDGGYRRPDFAASLERFRPDRGRHDGIEYLVLFPMYTQNASRDVRFEALLLGVPWPDWLAELERDRYDNAKFVPVVLHDHTAGYDSECAVLFPETVAVAVDAPRPANHFGAILCDRESERFRRVVRAAADLLGCNLPPDAAALVASPQLSQDAYELWDLIHDRAHSRGDLPFDPFMIRQRMPYWMYALEELRCDLTAFGEAVALEREGLAFARHVQYAILFDRLLRFPITGPRVRNYDGLGGQLLFAFLHRAGVVRWTDNRLTIDWAQVPEAVAALRVDVETLYRDGIDRSKLAQWGAAHDLVARSVTPAAGSRWQHAVRAYPETEDPRPYLDDVAPDEFPLSMFYVTLKQQLEPVLTRPPARDRALAVAA